MSMEEARANASAELSERGFRKIAWAFLKVPPNGLFSVIGFTITTAVMVDSCYFLQYIQWWLAQVFTPSPSFPHPRLLYNDHWLSEDDLHLTQSPLCHELTGAVQVDIFWLFGSWFCFLVFMMLIVMQLPISGGDFLFWGCLDSHSLKTK